MRSMILAACARSAAVDSNNFQSAAVGLIHTINAASPIRPDILARSSFDAPRLVGLIVANVGLDRSFVGQNSDYYVKEVSQPALRRYGAQCSAASSRPDLSR